MKIVKLEPKVQNNDHLIAGLQRIIDDVKSGSVTGYVALAISDGVGEIHFAGTSYIEDIAYTAILHEAAMGKIGEHVPS